MTVESTRTRAPRGERTTVRFRGITAGATAPRVPVAARPLWIWAGGGVIALAMVALLVVPAVGGVSLAATPGHGVMLFGSRQLVTANFNGNFTITKYSVVNNVTYLVVTTVRTLTGNMSGVFVAYEWGTIQANGAMLVNGTGTFVGSILGGAPGLVTISWHGATGTFGVSVSGTVQVGDGAKGLAGVHGSGLATVYFTGGSTFDGSYALDLETL